MDTKRGALNLLLIPALIGVLLLSIATVLLLPHIKEWLHPTRDETTAQDLVGSVELVGPDTLRLDSRVVQTLGVKTDAVQKVTQGQQLELAGSLAPDTDRLLPVRSRFAGEVVEIAETSPAIRDSLTSRRPLTNGDPVKEGDLLAVVWCKDLGEKKSELVDALSRLRLDKDTYERLQTSSGGGAIPVQALREAERNVAADRIAVSKAELTLRSWRLTDEEIAAIYKDAELVAERARRGEKAHDKDQEKTWARVDVKAPFDGVILERNVTKGAIVDSTTNLFMLGDLSKLHLFAYAYENDLPALNALKKKYAEQGKPIPWTIHFRLDPTAKPLPGHIREIRPFLDATQHTVLIRGQVDNPDHQLISGQFISAVIQLDPSPNEVEIPLNALIEDGQESVVFVEEQPDELRYRLRKVKVLRRARDKAYILSPQGLALDLAGFQALNVGPFHWLGAALTAALADVGYQPLNVGDRVVTAGALEMRAKLLEMQAAEQLAASKVK
jgi:cobalt-zinc-cadmium efflux system membrane fusion protein